MDTRTAEIRQAIIDNENAEDDNAQEVPQNVIEETSTRTTSAQKEQGGN